MRAVLDTRILKLATLPRADNPSALVLKLATAGLLECWASPAILEEYAAVLSDEPEVRRLNRGLPLPRFLAQLPWA